MHVNWDVFLGWVVQLITAYLAGHHAGHNAACERRAEIVRRP